ncbi:uracil-xanthine permease [Maribrevibacterium harenarium]|uniref:Uracil-xanthine permease n=1 Tax=Maribrevibacterium harenarium TaxID=2589817 RepID=A0A501WJA7_9GAMM|nr:uracil-xanthine permease family protein [Maribrevibacterium harenarium]TPE48440.1 uracil-xanthine permease [Maribrevibacterium harenarium]
MSSTTTSQANTLAGWRLILSGAQMLFVAFGSLVLVPLITGLDPSVALFTAGLGTLIFQFTTKRSIPVFLGSSFAFIAPIIFAVETWGKAATMGALFCAGLIYVLLAALVALRGPGFLHRLLPPVVIAPIIMVIGLGLAPVAVNMAIGKSGDGGIELFPYGDAMMVSMPAMIVTLLVACYAKGIFRLVPIIVGVAAGYLIALTMGMVDFSAVTNSSWVSVPAFVMPEFHIGAILFMLPVAIAPAIEHVGDVLAIGSVTGKNYVQKPGLHRTLLGDGVATSAAALFGGPPNTTYSEVTGAVMLTKAFNPVVMIWAAVFAVSLAFISKFGAFLQTIPTPVMGGILVILFGSIAGVGMNILIKSRVDLSIQRNLIIVAVTLVFGIGGMMVGAGDWHLQGVSLCGIVAIILNQILPKTDQVNDLHEEQEVVEELFHHK